MKTLLLLLLLLPGLAMAQAGRFLLAVGEVVIVRGAVETRAVSGATVQSGDTIRVGPASNAQVRLTDESIVSLRAGSIFRIDEYVYSGTTDGTEKSQFSLLKGGMRTITGLIGRLQDRAKYAVRTPTATVGIRGTHYTLVHCANDCGAGVANGDYGGVSDGKIGVANQTPEKEFGSNQFFHVADAATPPAPLIAPPPFLFDRLEGQSRTQGQTGSATSDTMAQSGLNAESRPSETPAPPQPQAFVVTETKSEQGDPCVINPKAEGCLPSLAAKSTDTGPQQPGVGNAGFSGQTANLAGVLAAGHPGLASGAFEVESFAVPIESQGVHELIFDASGLKASPCFEGFCLLDRNAGTVAELGSVPGVIEWGRWNGGPINVLDTSLTYGANQGLHYAIGVPTNPMPSAGTATFTLLGATRPTFSDNIGGGLGTGSMTSGTASVNFLTGVISANMALAFSGSSGVSNYTLAMPDGRLLTAGSPLFVGGGTFALTNGPVNVCDGHCPALVSGFFAGANASHLGLGYDIEANRFAINGVAVMKR